MFKRLLKLSKSLREFKKPTILTVIFIVLEAMIETAIPFITANLINTIKAGADLKQIIIHGSILFVLAMFSLVFGGLAGYCSAKASSGFARNLRNDMFAKIQTFDFENIDKFSTASLVTRSTTDINNVQFAFMMAVRMAFRSPLMLIFSIIMAAIMGGKLALLFVVIIPVLGLGLFLIAKKAMPIFERIFKKYDKLNESVEENVRGMRVVKGFAKEEVEKQKFKQASDSIAKEFTKAERLVALNNPLMNLCMYFNMLFVLFIGSSIAIKSGGQDLDVGQISAMISYGFQVLMSLMMLSMIYVMLTISAESSRRVVEVLDEKPILEIKENPVMEVKNGDISFKDVSFKYKSEAKAYALSNVNLDIKSGMTVGILGGTGSSKTTLVSLIPRLYDATVGEILVGDVNVKDYDLHVLRGAVSMVLQKNELFAGTIKENLRWGKEDATDEEIIEACKLARADEFINTLPEGYDTYIEQSGTNVSGGQKQRICIARALISKPKILILDDSTSAVDTKTDAMIRQSFKEYIPETTKIIIAQRISSVMDADMIIVLDSGKIVNVGTHDELLKSSPIYKEVFTSQTNGGEENE